MSFDLNRGSGSPGSTERNASGRTCKIAAMMLCHHQVVGMSVLLAGVAFASLGCTASSVWAADPNPGDDPGRAFFARHCTACHTGAKPKGDFRYDKLTHDFADKANREKWLKVIEQLKSGTMPPKGKPRPAADDVAWLVNWIDGKVATTEAAPIATHGRIATHERTV